MRHHASALRLFFTRRPEGNRQYVQGLSHGGEPVTFLVLPRSVASERMGVPDRKARSCLRAKHL